MKSRFLFPHNFKPFGWLLFSTGTILGIILLINDIDFPSWEIKVFSLVDDDHLFGSISAFEWQLNNITDEIASILTIVGGILVAFSKTKDEDEYIYKIRMESLIWATYVNYIVLIFAILFVFGSNFFNVLIYNMFTILLFFILRFHYVLYKSQIGAGDDE